MEKWTEEVSLREATKKSFFSVKKKAFFEARNKNYKKNVATNSRGRAAIRKHLFCSLPYGLIQGYRVIYGVNIPLALVLQAMQIHPASHLDLWKLEDWTICERANTGFPTTLVFPLMEKTIARREGEKATENAEAGKMNSKEKKR